MENNYLRYRTLCTYIECKKYFSNDKTSRYDFDSMGQVMYYYFNDFYEMLPNLNSNFAFLDYCDKKLDVLKNEFINQNIDVSYIFDHQDIRLFILDSFHDGFIKSLQKDDKNLILTIDSSGAVGGIESCKMHFINYEIIPESCNNPKGIMSELLEKIESEDAIIEGSSFEIIDGEKYVVLEIFNTTVDEEWPNSSSTWKFKFEEFILEDVNYFKKRNNIKHEINPINN